MRLKNGIFIAAYVLITSCGKEQEKNVFPSVSIDSNQVYFMTSDYRSKTSYLYSFDPVAKETHREAPSFFSGDVSGFTLHDHFGNVKNLYVAEKFSEPGSGQGLPTRLTQFDNQGNTTQNSKNIPVNLYDMIQWNNTLISAGHDHKEIAQTDLNLKKSFLTKTTVLDFHSDTDTENFFTLLKSNNNDVFALTIGYQYPNSFLGSKIYKLSQNFVGPTQQNWPIEDKGKNETCWDLYDSIKVTSTKSILACNPSYSNSGKNLTQNLDLFSVDLSNGTPVIKLLISKNQDDSTKKITLGGLSADAQFIFITEDDDRGDGVNPKVLASYWMNINDPNQRIPAQNTAYGVTYHSASQSYVFNCYLNNSHYCRNKTFAVGKNTFDNKIHENPAPISIDYAAGNLQFFKPIF